MIVYYPRTGQITTEEWILRGEAHRENDQPAEIHRNVQGVVIFEGWKRRDRYHREDGKPAWILYDVYTTQERWFLDGCEQAAPSFIKSAAKHE